MNRGSTINFRNVFVDMEIVVMEVVATETSIVYSITKEKLKMLLENHPILDRRIDNQVSKILRQNKKILIDVMPGLTSCDE
jgi:CRP-like cAMP-binding protein